MKLTDEQRSRIVKAMDESTNYIAMLAAGMRELAEIYYKLDPTDVIDWPLYADVLKEAADDLEAK